MGVDKFCDTFHITIITRESIIMSAFDIECALNSDEFFKQYRSQYVFSVKLEETKEPQVQCMKFIIELIQLNIRELDIDDLYRALRNNLAKRYAFGDILIQIVSDSSVSLCATKRKTKQTNTQTKRCCGFSHILKKSPKRRSCK